MNPEMIARPGQAVKSHLQSVSQICAELTAKCDLEDVGRLLGLLHDFGKYSSSFQNYLHSAIGEFDPDKDGEYVDAKDMKGKIDHSTAGAQWIWRYARNYGPQGQLVGQILATCLASHHGGLMDILNPEGINLFAKRMTKEDQETHFTDSLEKADKQILQQLEKVASQHLLIECWHKITAIMKSGDQPEGIGWFKIGLWARFLFSCLIDADRIDSADQEKPENKTVRRVKGVDWQIAIGRMEARLAALPIRHDIDHLRRKISDRCRDRAPEAQGV
jgi:CRISPR-associated endonuclease/helicase Cas3